MATSSDAKTKKAKKVELTPFEKELLDTAKKVNEYKEACEANVVSIIYKNPDVIRESNLSLEEISNNIWKVYFEIAKEIILVEKKNTLDDVTVGFYLERHDKLREKFDEYGGYDAISNVSAYVKEENFDGYLSDLRRWNAILRLAKRGFPVKDRLSEFCDMTAEDIYNEYEAYLNDIFVNIDSDVKSYDISDGIEELIEELDKGVAVGLPYHNMPMMTKETGGQYLGSITLVGGLSNVGKSTFARTSTIPSIIENGERIVIMLNEDGRAKWQRELLVYVTNVIFKFDLQKHIVRDGKYSAEVKDALYKSAQWIKDKTKDHTITIIPFTKYRTEQAIKVIKKFSSMGVKYFMLDTFKMDSGQVSDKSWVQMQQAMVDINDVVKPEVNNLHILITFQLSKGSVRQRYYTQDNIGMAKNIIDVASTTIMIRDVYDDEMPGGNRELKVYKFEGKNKKSKVPVVLSEDKHYQVLFIVKNREGAANQYQIVIEHDMSRNLMKEVGLTTVPVDF